MDQILDSQREHKITLVQLDQYQKSQDEEYLSPGDSPSQKSGNFLQPLEENIKPILNRAQKSFSRRPAHSSQSKSRDNSTQKKKNNSEPLLIFQQLLVNSLVAKFKNNLFKQSYVLSNKNKHILQEEAFLREDQSKHLIQSKNNKNDIFLFLPGDKYTLIWDEFNFFINLGSLWLSPFLASFQYQEILNHSLEYFIILHQFLDIVFQFNRAILKQGDIISDKKIIRTQYIKSLFYEDIIRVLSWVLMISDLHKIIIFREIIFLIQLYFLIRKVIRNYNNYIEQLYLKGAVSSAFDLVFLIALMYYCAHFMACVWHYIGHVTSNLGNTWILQAELETENQFALYNYSFYWAAMTMVTVGYGDIVPRNYIEMIFANIIMLISSFIFAYTMNSIGIIVKQYNDQKQQYTKQLIMMNSYMKKSGIDQKIQSRVRNYLKYQSEKDQNENSDSVFQIINEMSTGLKLELQKDLQTKIINQITLLNQLFSKQSLKTLVNQFEFQKYTPSDFIFHRGGTDTPHLYFVDEGEIQLIEENSKKVFSTIKKGQCFGEYQFFTGLQPNYSAISNGFTSIYSIKRETFIQQIKYHSKDFEIFHQIKDIMTFSQSQSILLMQCDICQSYSHTGINCPLLTYQPNVEQRLKKLYYRDNQERGILFKRENQKTNCRLFGRDITSSIKQYQAHQLNMQISMNPEQEPSSVKIQSIKDIVKKDYPSNNKSDLQYQNIKSEAKVSFDLNDENSDQDFKRPLYNRKTNIMKTILRKSKNQHQSVLQDKESLISQSSVANNPLEEFSLTTLSTEIDKIQSYLYYYTQGNIENVIRAFELMKRRKTISNFSRNSSRTSLYMFNLQLVQKIQRTKNWLRKRQEIT